MNFPQFKPEIEKPKPIKERAIAQAAQIDLLCEHFVAIGGRDTPIVRELTETSAILRECGQRTKLVAKDGRIERVTGTPAPVGVAPTARIDADPARHALQEISMHLASLADALLVAEHAEADPASKSYWKHERAAHAANTALIREVLAR